MLTPTERPHTGGLGRGANRGYSMLWEPSQNGSSPVDLQPQRLWVPVLGAINRIGSMPEPL